MKLGRHLKGLPATCKMHQLCLTLTHPLRMAGLTGALFCLSCLMKRKRAWVSAT